MSQYDILRTLYKKQNLMLHLPDLDFCNPKVDLLLLYHHEHIHFHVYIPVHPTVKRNM